MTAPRISADALAAFNRQVERARAEYRHHPVTDRLPDRYYAGCAHCVAALEGDHRAK